ncbi:MAG: DUF4277 domain-containing protein [Methanosarcinaceae archaeon]
MNNAESLEFESETIDALPIINHFIDRLGLDKIIEYAMSYANPSNRIMPYISVDMLLRNIIIGRLPVNGFKKCVSLFDSHLFNLKSEQVDYINDNIIDKALENSKSTG